MAGRHGTGDDDTGRAAEVTPTGANPAVPRDVAPIAEPAGPGGPEEGGPGVGGAGGVGGAEPGGRLRGVDVARSAALFGMMAIHIFPGRRTDGDISVTYLIASGRAAATFAVLAGVGLALASRGLDRAPARVVRGVRAGVVTRGLAIGAVGLALGYPESGVAVILPYYAVLFVLAAPLLRPPVRKLALIALAAATVVPVVSHVLRYWLPRSDGDNPTFGTLLTEPGELLPELLLTGYYPALPWLAYLAAGLAVGRLPLRSPRVAAGLLAGGAGLAAAAAACSELLLGPLGGRAGIAATTSLRPGSEELARFVAESQFGAPPTTTWWWLAVDSPHSSTPFDLLHTTGIALAALGLSLLAARVVGRLLFPLAAAGSMTLSLYTAHVLSLSTGTLPADPLAAYLVTVAATMLVATAWRSVWRRGPLEAAVALLANAVRHAATRRAPASSTGVEHRR